MAHPRPVKETKNENLGTPIDSLGESNRSDVDATRHKILGRLEREPWIQTWRFMTMAATLASLAIAVRQLVGLRRPG